MHPSLRARLVPLQRRRRSGGSQVVRRRPVACRGRAIGRAADPRAGGGRARHVRNRQPHLDASRAATPQSDRSSYREPAVTDLLHVTVAGATAVAAETWAKTFLLGGEHEAAAEADARRIPCVPVTRDGRNPTPRRARGDRSVAACAAGLAAYRLLTCSVFAGLVLTGYVRSGPVSKQRR